MKIELSSGSEENNKNGKYDEWFLEDAARTLLRAEEIKTDKKLMKALQPHLNKKAKAYKSLADLREARKKSVVGE
jgi:hypothetical protein